MTCTCWGVRPACASLWSTTVQNAALGLAMIDAVCPPWAPLMARRLGLTLGKALTIGSHAVDAWLVLRMPMVTRTTCPVGEGAPVVSRGTIDWAIWRPAMACAAGAVFRPPA